MTAVAYDASIDVTITSAQYRVLRIRIDHFDTANILSFRLGDKLQIGIHVACDKSSIQAGDIVFRQNAVSERV